VGQAAHQPIAGHLHALTIATRISTVPNITSLLNR
jgi:hypothetical protein